MSAPASSYDEVPYESFPFAQTHPDRLATVATLLGLRPPPVDQCRVLELGCAAGGNLIPMALGLSESRFLGVDLSARQIDEGRRLIAAMGLTNIELRHQSIDEIMPESGRFDYIICHGVYSWVPGAVQDKILQICAENLNADGIAYVSYNTLPGWHMRAMVRDLMLYHAQQFAGPSHRVVQARKILDFLARAVQADRGPYGLLLRQELELLRNSQDSYLFHEHLEDCNEAIYFHQFAERIAAKGLRYLGDADLRTMVPGNFAPEVQGVLQMLSPDLIHMEQYMDFLRNRTFRQTLICHKRRTPDYALRPNRLARLYVASAARPKNPQPDICSPAPEEFGGTAGLSLRCTDPPAKAAMWHLSQVWPRALPFGELLEAARKLTSPDTESLVAGPSQDAQLIGDCLLKCYTTGGSGLVNLYSQPLRFAAEAGIQPRASRLARLQAVSDNRVTNLRHETVQLGEVERHVLQRFDGEHDRDKLLMELEQLVERGTLQVREGEQPVRGTSQIRQHLHGSLEQVLPQLARGALLIE